LSLGCNANKLYRINRGASARPEGITVGVVNARYAKPIDTNLLISQANSSQLIVTIEDHVLTGGFGSGVLEILNESNCRTPVDRIGWPDRFIDHGSSVDDLRALNGLDFESIYNKILTRYNALETRTAKAALFR